MSNETYEERLNEFVMALSNAENIEKIEASFATEQGISISLCIPKENKSGAKPTKKSIHFLVESNESIGFFRLARIMSPVKTIIGYNYDEDATEDRKNILREYLKDPVNTHVAEIFSEIIRFSTPNINAIQKLLEQNYSKAFEKEDTFQRLGEKSFEQNFSSAKDEENFLKFMVGLMSCASARGIDANKVLRETEAKISQIRIGIASPGAQKK